MDALLWELLANGSPEDIVEVLIKLTDQGKIPADIEIVAQIGDIASGRIRRGDIEKVRLDKNVASMKASKTLTLDPPFWEDQLIETIQHSLSKPEPRRPDVPFTGYGVAIGVADWGFDFTHPNFINLDGSSRIVALWDQSAAYDGNNAYGYGNIHYQDEINAALDTPYPFQYLDYHPGKTDIFHQGMHGSHVLDIAAGNGQVGFSGIAPKADLICVHLATDKFKDLMGLGESSRVFDAIHFLDKTAHFLPLVINLSVGSHGDAHYGLSLIEQAIDYLVTSKKGRAVVQSCGNYYTGRTHSSGILTTGTEAVLTWLISEQDRTPNEIEIWYESQDDFAVSLKSPEGVLILQEQKTGKTALTDSKGIEFARYYHRKNEPNTQLSQILIILTENALPGKWDIILKGNKIHSGRYEAWIERDLRSRDSQSRFPSNQANSQLTSGSICNGLHHISVGATNPIDHSIGFFSSAGPTWDGRQVPFLTAPGIGILAAKSASPYQNRSENELTYKTGTSMAAPFVTGAIALLYEASVSPPSIETLRIELKNACFFPVIEHSTIKSRFGNGILDIKKLLETDQQKIIPTEKKYTMNTYNSYQFPVSEEALNEPYYEEFPELAKDNLLEFFESIPFEKHGADGLDIQEGDIVLRRQFGHHEPIWYGVVESIDYSEAKVRTNKGIRNVRLDNKWEIKRLRPGTQKPNAKEAEPVKEPIPDEPNELEEDNPITGEIRVARETDAVEIKTAIATKYGGWIVSATVKSTTSLAGDPGIPFGMQVAFTSKVQDGQRVGGAKTDYSYQGLRDILKGLKIKNLSIGLGGEWSGTEISAYGNVKFEIKTDNVNLSASGKIILVRFKEGETPHIGEIEGYFDSPKFEIVKSGNIKSVVFIRYKIIWTLDKEKIAKEILKKIAKDKLEKEAKKQGLLFLGRRAGQEVVKKLGPLITAFGVGWDIGTVLNELTIADEVALEIQNNILGDLNVRYHNADTLGKMFLIARNSPKIIGALAISGFTGALAGIGDLVLFKIFGLDKISASFGILYKQFQELIDIIPKVGEAFTDMIMSTILKMGIKLNPKYSRISNPDLRMFATAMYNTIKPIYRQHGGLDKMLSIKLQDIIVNNNVGDYHEKVVEFLVKNKYEYDTIKLGGSKDEVLIRFLDSTPQIFIALLEKYKLISYTIFIDNELSTASISQDLVDELFLDKQEIILKEHGLKEDFTEVISFEEDNPSHVDPAKNINEYNPQNSDTLVINTLEFKTEITGLINYKDWATNKSVIHNKRKNGYRIPASIIHLILHETASDTGNGYDDTNNTTSHMSVKKDVSVLQFNDLVEYENHGIGMNATGIGIEFVNRGWLSSSFKNGGEGIPAKESNLTENQKNAYKESNGYLWAFWGNGFNIYKLPTSLEQLEKLIAIVKWLTDDLHTKITSIPGVGIYNLTPWIEQKWLQHISYDEVKAIWKFNTEDIPTENERGSKNLFVMTTGYQYLLPKQLKQKSGIISHNGFYDGHSDGSFLALYAWLRLEKKLDKVKSYDVVKNLMKNHFIRVFLKSDVTKVIILLNVNDNNLH